VLVRANVCLSCADSLGMSRCSRGVNASVLVALRVAVLVSACAFVAAPLSLLRGGVAVSLRTFVFAATASFVAGVG
jgi:ABC-type multidrug transport system permease subunit